MDAPKNYCSINFLKMSLDVLPIIFCVAFVLWVARIIIRNYVNDSLIF